MSNSRNQILNLLKERLGVLLSISFGVFLFVLFFEPFPLERFDFNDALIFVAGLSAIVFVLMFFVRVVVPFIYQKYSQNDHEEPAFFFFLIDSILLVLSSVAFAFYLHYVGFIDITYYMMFKVFLICMAPVIVLRLYDLLNSLRYQNESLIKEKKTLQKQIEKYEGNYLNKDIEFVSNVGNEKLSLKIADVALIKSADNYVELVYKENESFNKHLIRNTLKNVEQQIQPYSNFIRCHRTCIINKNFIEKLNRDDNKYWLIIKGYEEPIPISRQYLLKLKEAL